MNPPFEEDYSHQIDLVSSQLGHKGKKILIVDDSPTVIEAVKAALIRINYEVAVQTKGLGTMVTILREKPDLILLDVAMPLMDGKVLCQMLKTNKAMEPMAHVPVIFFSSLEEEELKQIVQNSNAQGYITKNTPVPLIIKQINKILEGN